MKASVLCARGSFFSHRTHAHVPRTGTLRSQSEGLGCAPVLGEGGERAAACEPRSLARPLPPRVRPTATLDAAEPPPGDEAADDYGFDAQFDSSAGLVSVLLSIFHGRAGGDAPGGGAPAAGGVFGSGRAREAVAADAEPAAAPRPAAAAAAPDADDNGDMILAVRGGRRGGRAPDGALKPDAGAAGRPAAAANGFSTLGDE